MPAGRHGCGSFGLTDPRAAARHAFLAAAGWADARIGPLAGDASFRRYFRVWRDGRPAVLMDAPPPQEDVRPFLLVGRLLRRLGFSVPAVLAEDPARGFLLLEDLGDDQFTLLAGDPAVEAEIYAAAVDLLAELHRHHPAELPDLRLLPLQDHALLTAGLETFLDWYWPAASGAPAEPGLRADFLALWQPLLRQVRPRPDDGADVLVMRDFHADNLIWLPGRTGTARVGLLDFQDAVLGHPAYDLVSLLDDVRRDLPRDLATGLRARYLARTGTAQSATARSQFDACYAILGAQRNIRILGVFVRLWRRDGKARYLDLLPRTWAMLELSLAHPHLAALQDWLDRHLTPEARRRVGQPGQEPRMEAAT